MPLVLEDLEDIVDAMNPQSPVSPFVLDNDEGDSSFIDQSL
jgi:hypothetical protein